MIEMGKHKYFHESIVCLVCHGPSALFNLETPKDGNPYTVRLAKTMRRITSKTNPEKVYVHEEPCLVELVKNWAKYIVNEQSNVGLKGLVKRENETTKQLNPKDSGVSE